MTTSIMATEAAASPMAIRTQLKENRARCRALGERLRQYPPRAIMMIGRGSSDHAGVFAKYLFEVGCGVPVISAAPSVAGVFGVTLQLEECVAIAVSQSGRSPDILQQMERAKAGGAYCIALVNDTLSPLCDRADTVLPLYAGSEEAIAATKSYLASLSALCHLYASWKPDSVLQSALETLPDSMQQAQLSEPRLKAEHLHAIQHCVVIGRGFGYAIAREVALKLKEVLGIHAEAFSSAEFLHGPVTLADKQLCVINITLDDESACFHTSHVADISQRGARVVDISLSADIHKRLQALIIMQRFYLDIEQIAWAMGRDPDAPPGLRKVTETK